MKTDVLLQTAKCSFVLLLCFLKIVKWSLKVIEKSLNLVSVIEWEPCVYYASFRLLLGLTRVRNVVHLLSAYHTSRCCSLNLGVNSLLAVAISTYHEISNKCRRHWLEHGVRST